MWGIARLFAEGFLYSVDRIVANGGTVLDLKARFAELFPRQPMPHVNTFNAILNKVRLSQSIADRINRGIRPRAASYPNAPAGSDCSGFVYRVVVPVIMDVYGSPDLTRTVHMPVEVESDDNLNLSDIEGKIPGAIEAMQNTKDNYRLLRLGIMADRFETGKPIVLDAYRC